MENIFNTLKDFFLEDFDIKSYSWIILVLSVSIYFNYQYNFEDDFIDRNFQNTPFYTLAYFLFYSFAFFTALIPVLIFRQKTSLLKKKRPWFVILLTLLTCSFLVAENIPHNWFNFLQLNNHESYFVRKTINTSSTALMSLVLIPILMLITQSKEKPYYGITFKNAQLTPYFIMLLVMLTPLVWASYQISFQQQYPTLKFWTLANVFGLNQYQLGALWETIYGLSFVGTEILFRGALIIGLSQILGKNVILPAVAVYAFLHFGKPMPETIGSIFGGYILGIVALKKKNLFGGIIIHMGVAIGMDALAILQHYKLMP